MSSWHTSTRTSEEGAPRGVGRGTRGAGERGRGGSRHIVVTAADGATGGHGGLGSPVAAISDTECRLRVAHADRGSSSLPPPEYNGSNTQHAAANKIELEKRKKCGATPQQRADKALRFPGSLSNLKNF